ncbi:MAG: TraB/GumN family protein [Holophagae bacterium]|jgi:uncharacterized protein YbaP (TraB family)
MRHAVILTTALAMVAGLLQPAVAAEVPTFLWRVTSDTATVYLVGSIHAMRENSYPLPAAMETAYDNVDKLVFEVNLDELQAAALKMLEAGSLPDDQTLESVAGPEVWAEFSAHLSQRGMNPESFQGFKPWMAALNLTVFEMMAAGYLPTKGLDSYFSMRAAQDGKERMPLETIELQVGLFADLSDEQSLAFLQYTLQDLETMIPKLDDLSEQWRTGQIEPVEELLLEGFEEFPELFKEMVTDRNQAWMMPIEMLLAGESRVLVVVGALHLVGEQGLINQLRASGYTVEQL